MRWSDLRPGDCLVSKRTDRVHLILEARLDERYVEVEFFSLTTQRRGSAVKPLHEELNPAHYEVFSPGENG